VYNSPISIRQDGPPIPGMKPNRNAAPSGMGIECEDRLQSVHLENVPDLDLVLLPPAQCRLEHRDGALALPVEVDLHLGDLRPHVLRPIARAGTHVLRCRLHLLDFSHHQWRLEVAVHDRCGCRLRRGRGAWIWRKKIGLLLLMMMFGGIIYALFVSGWSFVGLWWKFCWWKIWEEESESSEKCYLSFHYCFCLILLYCW